MSRPIPFPSPPVSQQGEAGSRVAPLSVTRGFTFRLVPLQPLQFSPARHRVSLLVATFSSSSSCTRGLTVETPSWRNSACCFNATSSLPIARPSVAPFWAVARSGFPHLGLVSIFFVFLRLSNACSQLTCSGLLALHCAGRKADHLVAPSVSLAIDRPH